jgi:hypothetical protein
MSEAHTADLGTRYRYRREGAELERERIIKLLESAIAENGKDSWLDVIELIKGEQND